MNPGSTRAILLAGLGAMLFSAKAIVVKLCYHHGADTQSVLALRMLFSLPFFWGAVAWHSIVRRPQPLSARDVRTMLLLGFIGYYVASYFDFLGLRYISAGLERIILYLSPTIVLVLSAMLFGRRIARRQWLAMFVAYAGVTLVFLHDVRLTGDRAVLGSAFVLAGAVAYAIYLIYAGEIVGRVGSIRLVAYASASATFFCVVQSLVWNPQGLVTQRPEVYGLSLLNASLCTFVPMLLTMTAVNRVGSGLAAQAGVVGPVATVFLGWWFLGESVGLVQLAGVAVVLASMAVLLTVPRAAAPADRGL
jgi:drug/metabolite transporter (DMT)-like permease